MNALALVATHPEDVRTLVAHEPPLASILPDREDALAACRGRPRDLPAAAASGAGMAHFIARREPPGPVHGRGRRPAGARPGHVRDADRGRRHRAPTRCSARTSSRCTHFEPDFDALRAASTRIVVAAGAESEGELAHRGGRRRGRAAGHRSRWSSRATTAASSAASTARPATRTPSRRSCVRSCPEFGSGLISGRRSGRTRGLPCGRGPRARSSYGPRSGRARPPRRRAGSAGPGRPRGRRSRPFERVAARA